MLDVSTFMGPRFRVGFIDDIDKDGVIQQVTEEASGIARSSQKHPDHTDESEHQKDTPEAQDSHPLPAKKQK